MRIKKISAFENLPKKQQEIELIKERARQTYNRRHFWGDQIDSPKTEIGQYLEQRVKSELFWEDVIKRVAKKLRWKKLV